MKPPSENHELIRWLDGEMTEAERATFEESLRLDPVLSKEAGELRLLSASLRRHLPVELAVPHADFFNSQIQVRIAQMESVVQRSTSSLVRRSWCWLVQYFRQPWLAASTLLALTILVFILGQPSAGDAAHSFILSSYTPNPQVHARAFHDVGAGATVLMLDGLDAVPSGRQVSGIEFQRTETAPEFAATTSFEPNAVAVLMSSRESASNALIATHKPQ